MLNKLMDQPNFNSCTDYDTFHFILAGLNELTQEEKSELEQHTVACHECLRLSFEISEIMTGYDKPTEKDIKLLLRCLGTRLWLYKENQIIEKTVERIEEREKKGIKLANNEIKVLLAGFRGVHKDVELLKEDLSLFKKQQQKLRFSFNLIIAAGLILALLLLSIFVASSRNTLRFSQPINANLRAGTNYYDMIDQNVDSFLATRNISYILQAEEIALRVKNDFNDEYAKDLIRYYKTAPNQILNQSYSLRLQVKILRNIPNGDLYRQSLNRSELLAKKFIEIGNPLEAWRLRTLIAKFSIKVFDHAKAEEIINEGLAFSRQNRYLFLEANFMVWRAKHLTLTTDDQAVNQLEKAIAITRKLGLNELATSCEMSLVGVKSLNNQDQECLELAKSVLSGGVDLPAEQRISFLQLGAISAFKLGFRGLATAYLDEALALSKKESRLIAANTYTIIAVVETESGNMEKAVTCYDSAKEQLALIKEAESSLYGTFILTSYEAKTKLTFGDLEGAITLYNATLETSSRLGITSNLELSQIYKGLAIAFDRKGMKKQSQQHWLTARQYEIKALANNQQQNCLLSLAPAKCFPLFK